MIEKRTEQTEILIRPNGNIEVEEVLVFTESGFTVARSAPHRRVLQPDEDTSQVPEGRLKEIIKIVHTKEVIEEFKKAKEAAERELNLGAVNGTGKIR